MIAISSLSKSFGPKQVLRDVSLEIPPGKTTCIIGKSGCGKSVLLKHIVGLLRADSGEVRVDGRPVALMSAQELFALRRSIGYVFQSAALFDSMSVFDNVVLSLREHGERRHEVLLAEASRALVAVGLLPPPEHSTVEFDKELSLLAKKSPASLSGGMKKRVGVARALVGRPRYIFYDEPTTGLDPVTSEQIDSLIRSLSSSLNSTSVVITHDLFSVYAIAHKVVMLHEGRVRFEGSPEELRISADPVVREFIERYEPSSGSRVS